MLKSNKNIALVLFLVFSFMISPFFLNTQIQIKGEAAVIADETEEDVPLAVVLLEDNYEITVGESAPIEFDKENTSVPLNALEYHVEVKSIISIDKGTHTIKALAKGVTKVNITLQGNQDVLASFNVEVKELEGALKITNAPASLNRGQELQLKLEVSDSLAGKAVVWSVSGDSISINDKGLIKANKLGESKITAVVEGFTTEVVIKVLAPLNKINFNGEKIFLNMKEDTNLPSLIYVPYDTTDSKNATYSSSDSKIFTIKDGKLIAVGVGEAKLNAQVGGNKTSIDVVVSPAKNESGAEVMVLNDFTIDQGVMTFKTHDLDLFVSQKIALEFSRNDIKVALEQDHVKEIKVLLDSDLLVNDMGRIHSFIVSQDILDLIDDDLVIHLEDKSKKRLISYHLKSEMNGEINLKYSIKEINENDQLYTKIQTKSYFLKFYNDSKNEYTVSLPGKIIDTSAGQMHFMYHLVDDKLVDTYQNIVSSGNNIVSFKVDSNENVLTFNKIAVLSNHALIITLGSVAIILIGLGGFKLSKSYKNR